jgi:hypothetical protein
MTDQSSFPGGFPDRAAVDRVAMNARMARDILFRLESVQKKLRMLSAWWPNAKSSADTLSQYIEDGIDDSGIRYLLATAEERLARFEEEMGE